MKSLKLNIQKTKIMTSSPISSCQIDGETRKTVTFFISTITADGDATIKLKDTCSLEENYDKPRQHIKKKRHYFANKGLYNRSQSYDFFQ